MTDQPDKNLRTRVKAAVASVRRRWAGLIKRYPDWAFAPEPKVLPPAPNYKDFRKSRVNMPTADIRSEYAAVTQRYNNFVEQQKQQKPFQDETSKTIRRVFFALVGTSLFCLITVLGKADAALLASDAEVKLPILNYPMGFSAFLIVGPLVLIALTVYLHIFVGQHRPSVLKEHERQPMLPNFDARTAKITVAIIFYWMVPLTLAVFTWKAWPRPAGPFLYDVTLGLAVVMVWLQMRRLPGGRSRLFGPPLLVLVFGLFAAGLYKITDERQWNLFKADLSGQDLRGTDLTGADLREAILNGANLSRAGLNGADLSFAELNCLMPKNGKEKCVSLTDAKLNGADLSFAELNGVDLSDAELNGANLHLAKLNSANLSRAELNCLMQENGKEKCANLYNTELNGASLHGAKLNGANLLFTKLNGADLHEVELNGAILIGAELNGADLRRADLTRATITQPQLDAACGKGTILDMGLTIEPCPPPKPSGAPEEE